MKIRMLEDHDAALDGVNIETFRGGCAYLVPDDIAEHWIDNDLADEDTSAGTPETTSVGGKAPASSSAPVENQGGDGASLAKLNKDELVAYAAKLDPPLVLDPKSKKDELLAAIAAHPPAGSGGDAGDGGGDAGGDSGDENQGGDGAS